MMTLINTKIPNQPKEQYYGNREYKLHLTFDKFNENDNIPVFDFEFEDDKDITSNINKQLSMLDIMNICKNENIKKINKRASQLVFRLYEGNGKALYMIGFEDDGEAKGIPFQNVIESYWYLFQMCKIINAKLKTFRIYKGNDNFVATSRINMEVIDDFF